MFQRPAERPRTPADPAEILRAAEETGWCWRRQGPSFIWRHAGHREYRLPVQPAFLLPQLPARQLGHYDGVRGGGGGAIKSHQVEFNSYGFVYVA